MAEKIFYVSSNGNDNGNGSLEAPFQTLGRAQEAAREYGACTVKVQKGVYLENMTFDARDNGMTWLGEDVVISGGIKVPMAETMDVPQEIRELLNPEAADKIRAIDLSSYGYTREDWGEVYPIGAFHTADKYDNAKLGVNIEVFSGEKRMILARYPNEGYLQMDDVLDQGEPSEYPSQNRWVGWQEKRNPKGGTYIIDVKTNERVKSWKHPETAWMFGYFFQDWADASTPVANFNTDNRAVSPEYVSVYGCKKGGEYFFYNVLEELDAPGEYYLDRETGMLYVYPYQAEGDIGVSVSTKPLITAEGVENLTVEGFHLTFTRNTAAVVQGDHCVLKNLLIDNVAEYGIKIAGSFNTVDGCEITRTGKGGIWLEGGDRITLTQGGNKAVNNYIHHFSELYKTYQPGIKLEGVGNSCAHNEISFSPFAAIIYWGNEHLIEYNNIHDVVLYSCDAGAIYSGRNWTSHGTVIRYNILKDIGIGKLEPDGIYWDDALSGQTAYGNILINVKKYGFLVGGGRDNVIRDNVIIGESREPICYDNRAYDAWFGNGWFKWHVRYPQGDLWERLEEVPYREGIWAEKYPTLAAVTTDLALQESPEFPVNPANVIIENNIVINEQKRLGHIGEATYRYGTVGENRFYSSCEEAGFDLETLKFTRQPEGFPEIPVDEIGRK